MTREPPEPIRAQWTGRPERGSALLARVMMFLSLQLGRPVARGLLQLIAAYFFVFAPAARRHSRAYLRRALGREPTASDRYRHVFAFASTLLDRFYLTRERYDLLDISIDGEELVRAAFERGTGAFLLGAHLGSFELMSTVGRRQPGLRVALAMYTHNLGQVATDLAYGSAASPEIIPLGEIESMLRIRDALAAGKFVGMLADRSFEDAPGHSVSFLGAPALFPTGPMRAAAVMRAPVIFMAGLYRGGNRYHVLFRELADFSQPTALTRAAAVSAAIERYAALLEECCRSDPYNWFNFYDFWHGAGESVTPARTPHGRTQLGGVLLAGALTLSHPGGSAAAAAANDQPAFEQLLKLLSGRRHGHVTFTEVQRLSILEQPLHSSGELLYEAPDRLEKRTLEPRPEDLRLEHGTLSVERDHHRRSVALAEFPQAVPFIESVRATLAGDRAALERYFTVDFSGDLGHWTLELLPIDATMRRSVRRVLISGERDTIRTVDVQQMDGDSSTLTLGPELTS